MAAFEVIINPASLVRTIRCVQADACVEIADSILEHGDPEFLSVGDGIVTFHCGNGDVTYALTRHDDLRETWIGIRAGIDQDDA